MSIPVKLEVFEGPLDLLLHLIDKHKLNIYDIPIATITDQYLEHIGLMEANKMELMSEFIEMAATLINIKSRMLLPIEIEEEDEIDPRAELIEKLIEYKKFKLIAGRLREKQEDAGRLTFKEPSIPEEILNYIPEVNPDSLLEDINFSMLYSVFQSVMKKKRDKIDPIRSKYGEIKKEEYTVQDKIDYIKSIGENYQSFSFRDLLLEQRYKVEIIITFLAVLELMKLGLILITQEVIFDDIIIKFTGRD